MDINIIATPYTYEDFDKEVIQRIRDITSYVRHGLIIKNIYGINFDYKEYTVSYYCEYHNDDSLYRVVLPQSYILDEYWETLVDDDVEKVKLQMTNERIH